jgi:hypothetical protein
MKNTFLFLLLILSTSLFAAKKSKSKMVVIEGFVTQTSDYCGGAAPSEEMLENLRKPVPLAEKVLYIRIGAKNKPTRSGQNPIYKKVVTDANGKFSVKLKSNVTYCFIEGWKAKPFKVPANTAYIVWDAACLYEKYVNADLVIKVSKSKNEVVKINYHQPCFFRPYCGTYSGPLPP